MKLETFVKQVLKDITPLMDESEVTFDLYLNQLCKVDGFGKQRVTFTVTVMPTITGGTVDV